MFYKTIATIVAIAFLIAGAGFVQLRMQDIADAKCTKRSSAPDFWLYRCPDGRAFYIEKTPIEKRKYGAL